MVEDKDMLEHQYKEDTERLKSFPKRLLEPGWSGELAPAEFNYIKSQLKLSPLLRRRWGFRPSAKRLSECHIRTVARDGTSAIR